MSTITFDTLKFVEKLEAGGFSHTQAKAAAEAFAEATSQELASKGDVRDAINEAKIEIIKWIVGLALAQMTLIAGILIKITSH